MSLIAALEMELPMDLTLEAEFLYDGTKHLYNGYSRCSPLIETIALSRGFLNNKLTLELDMQGFVLSEKTEEKGGERKMAQIEERESLMESEKDVEQRK